MNRKVLGAIFGVGIYVSILASIDTVSASNAFAWLGFSIAVGSMVFFMVFAPYGVQDSTTVFGRKQRYKAPVPTIPIKVACGILVAVLVCLAISFGLYHVNQ